MGKVYYFLTIIVLMSSLSSAGDITYKITGNEVLTKISSNQNETIFLPADYLLLESNRNYNIIENKLITNKANITFTTENYIRKIGNEYLFNLPRPTESNSNIQVYLPQNHILANDIVFPKNYKISSNGINIILGWENFNDSEIIIFYKGAPKSNLIYIIIGTIIAMVTILLYIQRKKFKRKIKTTKEKQAKLKEKLKKEKKQAITKNLFEEEKKIIEYLLSRKNKSAWTTEISKDLEIPKVRLSRKLRSLLEKELIRKEPYGNKNMISLK
ncbi:MAG: hypothetical protein OEL87_02435 [Nanoarchaeota archaeon]|nr:hypothetical protein [Nanoarchaeota archaeon]